MKVSKGPVRLNFRKKYLMVRFVRLNNLAAKQSELFQTQLEESGENK